MFPHARTLRKAREQVKNMVTHGFSTHEIRIYLQRWALWWRVNTSELWQIDDILNQYSVACWDLTTKQYGVGILAKLTYAQMQQQVS